MTRAATRPLRAAILALIVAGAAAAAACGDGRPDTAAAAPRAGRVIAVRGDSSAVADLPLIEVPATGHGAVFAVLVSGDGGWAPADRGLSRALAERGVPVVGLSAPRYLARARTPDEAARDLARIVRHYAARWGRGRVVVIGYSRGADLAPFMVSRLPDDLHRRVALVVLMGPIEWAGIRNQVLDLVKNTHRAGDLPVWSEIEKLRGTPVLCIYGRRDRDAICPSLDTTLARPVRRAGGHAVTYWEGPALADTILRVLALPAPG